MSTVVKDLGAVSAYAYAVEKGYTGTEAEFAELMADYAEVGQRAEDAADRAEAALDEFTSVTADATTLPEGSSATAEYSDGHLTLGIPKGDKGDGAYHVELSGESFVIHTDASGVAAAQEFMIYIDARQGTTKKVISRVEGLPSISTGSGTIAPEIIKHAFTGSVATIIYTIPANTQISAGQINAQYTAYINDGTANGFGVRCALSVAVVKDGAKGDKGDTGDKGDKGDKGDTGNTGNTPNLTIGTVTTLQPTAPATATISGTADNPVLSFGIPKGDTGEVSQAQFDAALALKADAIGNYPELAVGTAEQIDSDTVVSEDVAPYQFRQSISGASNRAYDKIVGGSLAVNQLVPDLGTLTSSGSKAFNNGTAKIAGHKYLFSANISADGNTVGLYSKADDVGITEIVLRYSVQSAIISAKKTATSDGTNNNSNGNMWLYPYIPNGSISNIMFIDLTLMLGSTIADYVYTLETATAGAGVAWLKAHFPKIFDSGYIPYNAGTLEHVSGLSAHKMVGFNQLDEEWENGLISISNGQNTNGTGIRSKNYNRCLPNTQYYHYSGSTGTKYLFWYDENKNFISHNGGLSLSTSPSNAHYFRVRQDSIATYNHDICINLHWDGERDGEYEPYEEHSYSLDSDVTLRGIPKLDANNNLYYDGDEYEADGTVTRRYGIVDLGTLTWSYFNLEDHKRFGAPLSSKPSSRNLICTKYQDVGYSAVFNNTAEGISIHTDGSQVAVYDTAYTDAADFKAAMSGVMLVYELATPTTESAQPFTNPQVVDASGTEEYVTDSVVSVGHVTKYVENLKAKLESAPASPAEDGDYIVRQTDGVNEYVPLDSAPAITAKADVTDLLKAFPVDTASGSIASFTDGAELPIKSLAVDIDPVQDLHGQSAPYPAGGQIWDEEWELGSINSVDGQNTVMSDRIRSKNYIPVQSNTEYYVFMPDSVFNGNQLFIALYRDDKTYIRSSLINAANGFTSRKLPATFIGDAAFIRLWFASDYGTTYNHDISINYPATDTAYHPYSNICPISGHTQAVVTRTGVNVWDEEWELGGIANADGAKYTDNARIRSKNYIPVFPSTTYYFKMPSAYLQFKLVFYDADKTFISYTTKKNETFVTPANCHYMMIAENTTDYGTTYNHDVCINYPSTDHDYHPHSGQSITIAFGQTVYGGTLDVLSGELVIDRAGVDMGTLAWASNGTDSVYTPMLKNKLIGGDNCVCSALAKVAQGTQVGSMSDATFKTYANSADVAVRLSGITNQNAQTMLSGFQFVYPLATPITVTLTPHEVRSLLGSNNVWSDAGEVTAEYRADPTLYIQRKIAEALS